MKRILIGVAVLALAGCEAQEPPQAEAPAPRWTLVRYKSGVHYFVTQPEMIEGRQRIWLASLDDQAKVTGQHEASVLFDVDCVEQSATVLDESARDADGNPVRLRDSSGEVIYPNPDSVLYRVVGMACGREQIVGPGFNTIRQAKGSETLKEIEQAEAADPQ